WNAIRKCASGDLMSLGTAAGDCGRKMSRLPHATPPRRLDILFASMSEIYGYSALTEELRMPNTKGTTLLLSTVLAVAVLLSPDLVRAEAADDFYAGKQISLLIGTTPGGGYDAYGRLLARHLGRHIPGNPAIVAKNMPGAGGLTLANHLYNRAPKDGTEIATVQNGLPFEKLFHMLSPGGSNALFDSTKFGWIGSMTQTVFVTVTWHTAPVKTLQDAVGRETILGASTTSSDSYVLAMLSNNMLGTRFKV